MPIAKVLNRQPSREMTAVWPVPHSKVIRIGQSVMVDRGGKEHRPHKGVDIYAPQGTEVLSVTDGTVLNVGDGRNAAKGSDLYRAGLWVDILHDGKVFRYLHLGSVTFKTPQGQEVTVKEGDKVKLGDQIGTIAGPFQSGLGKGAENTHVHFEVRKGETVKYGSPLEPTDFLYMDSAVISFVALPSTEDDFRRLELGSIVYDKNGSQAIVTKINPYPYFEATEGSGKVEGLVTADIQEAANWAVESAVKDSEYSFAKDGALGLNSWALRVPGESAIREATSNLAPHEKYLKAMQFKSDIAKIRKEGIFSSQAEAFKSMGGGAVKAVRSAPKVAGMIVGGVWDEIPTYGKVALGVATVATVALVVKKVTE